MSEPKISVIVPVYKVEPYLRKCLDSIVGQTYQNLEIILVDDGSPDNCGAICDEYASKDNRFRVIHQENGGLSSARNAALKVSTGDYLGFVDSDDWIEPDMYEVLLRELQKAKADISVCGHYREYGSRTDSYGWSSVQELEKERAFEELLRDGQIKNWVWDKLYRRSLFDGIWFPKGKTYEDVAVMHWLFLRAEKVVCISEVLYHYLQRTGSILSDVSLRNRISHYAAVKERYDILKKDWPQFERLMVRQCAMSLVGVWYSYCTAPRKERQKLRLQLQEAANFTNQHYEAVQDDTDLGLAGRLILRLASCGTQWAFALIWIVGKLYQWKHRQTL